MRQALRHANRPVDEDYLRSSIFSCRNVHGDVEWSHHCQGSCLDNGWDTSDSCESILAGARPGSTSVRLITYNIRYAATSLAPGIPGEKPWSVRRPRIGAQLRFIAAGQQGPFFCLQEVLHSQLKDIQAELGPSWAFIGRGRGANEFDGEATPIFYRTTDWTCDRSEVRWLSPTPGQYSVGWDASLPRIVTMGEFSNKRTGARVVIFSTHLDHLGTTARRESAHLLSRFAREWNIGEASPVFIAGDFNSKPDEEAYRIMTAPGSGLHDVSDFVPVSSRHGNRLTYTTFGEPDEVSGFLDYIFVKNSLNGRVSVKGFSILANSFDDGILLSDHRPIVADLQIGSK